MAYFGGDQVDYPDIFKDVIGTLSEKIVEQGGETVGYWPTGDYELEQVVSDLEQLVAKG